MRDYYNPRKISNYKKPIQEDLKKIHKDLSDFHNKIKYLANHEMTRIKIEHFIMKYPDSSQIYDCPKCRYRVYIDTQNPMWIDDFINWFFNDEIYKQFFWMFGKLSMYLKDVKNEED